MKGGQLATIIWMSNLLVLAGGAFFGYRYYTDIEDAKTTVYASVSTPKSKEKRQSWQDSSIGGNATSLFAIKPIVSPRDRPVERPPDQPKPPDPPKEVDPTDAQLQADIEKFVNDNFKLIRLWGPTGNATITAKDVDAFKTTLQVFPGMNFKTEFATVWDKKLQALAKYDFTIVSLHMDPEDVRKDYVLVKANTQNPKWAKFKDKFFEVQLKMISSAVKEVDINKLGRSKTAANVRVPIPENPVPPPDVEVTDNRPKESTYNSERDEWTIGTDDYNNAQLADELARYAKVAYDRDGKPLGIQISDELPDDNVVSKRGGRRGDIIKAINGKPVASMADVKRVVRTDYDAGVERFEVTYERDGVEGTKVFIAPKKKDK